MIIPKLIVFFIMWFVLPKYIRQIKISGFMKKIRYVFSKIKFLLQRVYRVFTFSKTNNYVWKDLIKYHKRSGWRFGQFDNEKSIECSFKMDDNNYVTFKYTVNSGKLFFSSTILQSFDEEHTNDILVLASHFNNLLNFGVVKVSINYNFVDFVYTRDLLTYSLFSGEIDDDTIVHFNLTKDVFWSFNNMIQTGEDPVFVFSELMKRREERG
jgi:hypothetical protein